MMRVSDEYLQMTLRQLERERPLDSQLISTTFYQMLCNEIVERRAEAPPNVAPYLTALVRYIDGWYATAMEHRVPASLASAQAKHAHNAILGICKLLDIQAPRSAVTKKAGHIYSPRPGTEVCFICGFHKREHAPEHMPSDETDGGRNG